MSSTLGKRLRTAIETATDRGSEVESIRGLSRILQEKDVSGSSRQMIHDYLSDKRDPSLEFLRAAADELDVSEAWLVTNFGDMPREPLSRTGDEPVWLGQSGWTREVYGSIRDKCGLLNFDHWTIQALFWETLRRAVETRRERLESPRETIALAVEIDQLVLETLAALGSDRLPVDRIEGFVVSMLQAVWHLFPQENRNRRESQ